MRKLDMMDWRMVQLFLSDEGVYEVELDMNDNRNQRCNCPKFAKRNNCKHIRWVERKINDDGGHYSIQIPYEVDEEIANEAFASAENFRAFVIEHARVEVL